ncbi:MAG: hypothetical protein EOO43_03910 [Flavobacterium sp.]|nr:MAG: hypothetical protein EOO43_03910 [Flavobacterium sp.]
MKRLSIALLGLMLNLTAPAQSSLNEEAPVSDLGHIDVILDSASWYAIKNSPFIQNEFGVLNVDTTYYSGKPSYDLYVLGQLNFLHLSLARGFWNNQKGGAALVFQTQKPGQKESLLHTWKQFYPDSLFLHSFKGNDFVLDEIMAWYKPDSTRLKQPTIFANLTSYSVDAYKNWGISDSIITAGLAMQQFMGDWGGEPLKSRLFHSITALYMTINQQELKEIKSVLRATGYTEANNIFTHSFNPTIYITVNDAKVSSKYSKVKFKLTRSVVKQEIKFGANTALKLDGKEAWFIFK